jgi:hypothetical protein
LSPIVFIHCITSVIYIQDIVYTFIFPQENMERTIYIITSGYGGLPMFWNSNNNQSFS